MTPGQEPLGLGKYVEPVAWFALGALAIALLGGTAGSAAFLLAYLLRQRLSLWQAAALAAIYAAAVYALFVSLTCK